MLAATYEEQAPAGTCEAVLVPAAQEKEALKYAVPNLRTAQYPAARLSKCRAVQKVCQIRHRRSHDGQAARQALYGAELAQEAP